MIEIQPVELDAVLAHNNAIQNATHLLSCSDYLIEALPEEVQELPILADLTVLLGKVGDEISAARVKFEKVEKAAPWRNQEQEQPQEEESEARPTGKLFSLAELLAPHKQRMQQKNLSDEMHERAAKQDAGKQALNELRSALMQQTIMISQLANNAGIEDINTEHEATKLAKEIYFAMDRAWDCVSRATA